MIKKFIHQNCLILHILSLLTCLLVSSVSCSDSSSGPTDIAEQIMFELEKRNIDIDPEFDIDTFNYSAIVSNNLNEVMFTVTFSENFEVKINSVDSVSGQEFTLDLTGLNTITIEVKEGSETRTYNVQISRGTPGETLTPEGTLAGPGGTVLPDLDLDNTTAIDLDADTLAAGDGDGNVHVLVRDSNGEWSLEQTITRSQAGGMSMLFGSSLAVDGDTMVVGAPNADDINRPSLLNPGLVYVFQRSNGTWNEVQVIASPDANESRFGNTVAIDGDYMAAKGIFSAKLRILKKDTVSGLWSFEHEVGDMLDRGHFGFDGNTLVTHRVDPSNQQSFISVSTRNGSSWSETQRIEESDVNVANIRYITRNNTNLHNDTLIFSVVYEKNATINAEKLLVYKNNGTEWVEQDQFDINTRDKTAQTSWQSNVELHADAILTSSIELDYDQTPPELAPYGEVSLYKRTNDRWSRTHSLNSPEPAGLRNFGADLTLSNNTAIIMENLSPAPGQNRNRIRAYSY